MFKIRLAYVKEFLDKAMIKMICPEIMFNSYSKYLVL